MPDRVFCRRHDPDGHANWDSGFRPLLDDTCYMCATSELEQAHRAAEESAKDAHRRGWEQAKREAYSLSQQHSLLSSTKSGEIEINELAIAIAEMEYKERTNG